MNLIINCEKAVRRRALFDYTEDGNSKGSNPCEVRRALCRGTLQAKVETVIRT